MTARSRSSFVGSPRSTRRPRRSSRIGSYTLLVAVILSAQATDVSVNKATEPLFKVANTPAAMIALGEDRLIPYIRTIGLFRNKAKAVIAMSRRLLEAHGGKVPNDRDALQALPGRRRKTATRC